MDDVKDILANKSTINIYLLGLIIAVGIIALGFSVYIFAQKIQEEPEPSVTPTRTTPTSSPTPTNTVPETRSIYQNSIYNYEVSYPMEWKGGETSVTTNYATFSEEAKNENDFAGAVITIQVFQNLEPTTVEQWWQEQDSNDGAEYSFEGERIVGEQTALVYQEKEGLDSRHVILKRNSQIYLISRIGFNNTIFDSFLDSLVFTN